jgi:hypothetical protein
MAKRRLLLGILIGLATICWQALATALPCDLNVPSTYATVAAAVTAATNGQVICVAAGQYDSAFFNLAAKGLTLQGAQAGVDARTRPARSWAFGDTLPSSTETVFTHSGQNFFTITGGLGATVDGIFVSKPPPCCGWSTDTIHYHGRAPSIN